MPRSTTCVCTNLPFLAWPASEDGGWRRIWGLAGVQPRESVPTSPFWHGWPTGRRPLPRSTTCVCTNLPFLAWPAPESGGWRRIWGLAGVQPRESVPTSPFWHPRPTRRRLSPRSTTCIRTNLPFLGPKAHATTAWSLHSAERSPVHAARRSKSPEQGRIGRSQCGIRACRRSGLVGVGTSKIICNHPGTRVPAFRTLCTACPYWTG